MANQPSQRKQLLQFEIDEASEIGFSLGAISTYSSFGVVGFNMLTVKDANDTHEFYADMSRIVDKIYMKSMAFSYGPIEADDILEEGDD